MSKNVKRTLLGLAAVVILVGLALPKLPSGGNGGEVGAAGEAGPGDPGALTVDVHVVQPVLLRDRTLAVGSLIANEVVDLRSEASGRLVEIGFTEGSPVSEGDLLARINDRDLQAQRSRLESRKRLVEQREARQTRLVEEGGVSQEDLDATRSEREVLEAELEMVEAELEKTQVRAPFDGVVGLRRVSPGSYISPETSITTVQVLDPLRLQFSIPARYSGRVAEGDPVRFRVEGEEADGEGVVYVVDPAVQEGTRTLALRARTPNPDGRFRPGAFATVDVIFDEVDDALTVPSVAVRPQVEGQQVFVYRDGEAQAVPVETGIRTRSSVQITEGLQSGDSVITTGFHQLQPGVPVAVAEVSEGLPAEEPAEDDVLEEPVQGEVPSAPAGGGSR